MDEYILAVAENLEAQKKINDELLALAHQKRQAVMKNDVDTINEIVQKEMALLSQLTGTEKKRVELTEKLADIFGCPVYDLTIGDIAEMAEGNVKEQLLRLKIELRSVLNALLEINSMNKDLLKTQMDHVEVMLNVIVGDEDPIGNNYDDSGKNEFKRKQSSGLIDKQA